MPRPKKECHIMEAIVSQPNFNARVIQVIESNLAKKGDGSEANPYRRLIQYYSLDGRLLFEIDPWKESNDASE